MNEIIQVRDEEDVENHGPKVVCDYMPTKDDAAANDSAQDNNSLRSLILEMHCRVWVWHFIVKVFILETNDGHVVPQYDERC